MGRARLGVLAAWTFALSNDAVAQSRPGSVDVTINIASVDSVHVEERYVAAGPTSPLELRALTRPCASIENVHIERSGMALVVSQSRQGPWITLRDSTASTEDTMRLLVRYDVRGTGSGIPLLHLTSPITGDSARPGPVAVTVRFADTGQSIAFPHMRRQAPDEWSARYVAIPSFVQMANGGEADCNEDADQAGDNGGLVWRFFVLVGIMVAWVPLYLAWARRTMDTERA